MCYSYTYCSPNWINPLKNVLICTSKNLEYIWCTLKWCLGNVFYVSEKKIITKYFLKNYYLWKVLIHIVFLKFWIFVKIMKNEENLKLNKNMFICFKSTIPKPYRKKTGVYLIWHKGEKAPSRFENIDVY